MNHNVPNWNMEDGPRSFLDLPPMENPKKSMVPGNELVELLWQNGHVVMHSQNHRRSPPIVTNELKQPQKPGHSLKCGGSLRSVSDLIHEEEAAPWFHYPLDDSLEKEFCSEFFCEMPAADGASADKFDKDVMTKGSDLCFQDNTMPPPKSNATGSNQQAPSLENGGVINFSHFSRPMHVDLGLGGFSSMTTIGSSDCGSNKFENQVGESHTFSNGETDAFARSMKADVQMRSPREGGRINASEANVPSSSGGSGSSFGRTGPQGASNQNHKRKGRYGEESECHSEEANKPAQRSASARRSRATEVHNLSERRRRDRINEKMKALQELIPHCNKSDKASMLDEAIEYLKSLQLQVQIMWMGSGGMAPMMFPGVQRYMPCMGVGTAHALMPSLHHPVQLPRVPSVNRSIPSAPTPNQALMCPSPALNPANFPTQMQNINLPESYSQCFGFHRMQLPPQAINLYTYGSHTQQQNQQAAAASTSGLHVAGAVPSEQT